MKTIEERAIDYASHSYIEDGNINTYINELEKQSYIQGATEQKSIDIDMACEWLRSRNVLTEASIEGFRKVLEERL